MYGALPILALPEGEAGFRARAVSPLKNGTPHLIQRR